MKVADQSPLLTPFRNVNDVLSQLREIEKFKERTELLITHARRINTSIQFNNIPLSKSDRTARLVFSSPPAELASRICEYYATKSDPISFGEIKFDAADPVFNESVVNLAKQADRKAKLLVKRAAATPIQSKPLKLKLSKNALLQSASSFTTFVSQQYNSSNTVSSSAMIIGG
jgi:hypothetical protein